jgi:hypothetical protein
VFLLSTNEFEFGQIGAARDYLPVLAVTGGRIRHRDRQLLRPVGESSAAETPDKRRNRTCADPRILVELLSLRFNPAARSHVMSGIGALCCFTPTDDVDVFDIRKRQ